MKITLNQVSALQKIKVDDAISTSERSSHTVLQGQRLSYQVVIGTKGIREKTRRIWIESPLKDYIRLYRVKEVIVDVPSRELVSDEDYLLTSAGNLPDVLIPLELQGNYAALSGDNVVIWVKIDIPKTMTAGSYPVKFFIETALEEGDEPYASIDTEVRVIPSPLPEQKRIASYLDKVTEKVDEVIAKRKAELERLEAAKRSIICECVTGKRVVSR